MVEKLKDSIDPITPRRRISGQSAEGKVFEAGASNAEANSFQRRLVAAREKGAPVKVAKNEVQQQKEAENIRQWQKHYRKIFPTFSFYFESIPEDMRARFTRQVTALGAREEKFFSKTVTHIVTTRPIPSEVQVPESSSSNSTSEQNNSNDGQPQTINPSLLEKNPGPVSRTQAPAQTSLTTKREAPSSTDILVRGRQMGMKIWASEKFQRILASVLESADTHGHNTRGHHTTQSTTRLQQEDLSQVLRKEKLGTDRDQATLSRDIIVFKGPFIYIHDIDEKVRPTMVRDYQKPKCKGDGEWPQFRTSGAGKCPFVEDMSMRRELEQERKAQVLQQQQQQQEAELQAPRTRSMIEAKMEPPRRTSPRKALTEVRNFTAGPILVSNTAAVKPQGPPVVERQSSILSVFARHATATMRPPSLQFGGEPAASGIQRSNLTSAIQSQMISSTAAAPGGKAATSKEVNELKRKVLERSHTGSLSMGSVNSIPSSHRMTDLAGALKNARAPAPQRAAKSAAKEKLGGIPENDDPYADDMAAERAANAASKKATKKPAKREAKPGYCENCRDKYDDFEEHTVSRKHRKFALTTSNWTELDDLLSKIQS